MVTTEVGDLVFTMDVNGILLIPLCTVAGSKYRQDQLEDETFHISANNSQSF